MPPYNAWRIAQRSAKTGVNTLMARDAAIRERAVRRGEALPAFRKSSMQASVTGRRESSLGVAAGINFSTRHTLCDLRHPSRRNLLLYGVGAWPPPDGVREDRSANLR